MIIEVLCEGYHDRAFWAGLLTHLGWQDARPDGGRGRAHYPDGRPVELGVFAFRHGQSFLVVRLGGGSQVRAALRGIVERCSGEPPGSRHVVVSLDVDDDSPRGQPLDAAATLRAQCDRVASWLQQTPLALDPPTMTLGTLSPNLTVVPWFVTTPDHRDAPTKQTLERLVVSGIVDAYPQRADTVRSWLAGCGAATEVKAWSWSHMAGWYAPQGCDHFLRSIWEDPAIATRLVARLVTNGVWGALVALG